MIARYAIALLLLACTSAQGADYRVEPLDESARPMKSRRVSQRHSLRPALG